MADKKKISKNFTRALFDVSTINNDNRTVDVIFATETPVMRSTWDGPVNEILICEPNAVRMQRINSGAPLLDTHDKYSVKSQLGVVENATISNKQLRATVRFSKNADVESVWQNVVDGIVRGISVGYRVYQYETTQKTDGSTPEYRAVDWEPFEISLVPVPADFNSGTRSDVDFNEVIIINHKNSNTMTPAEQRAADITAACRAAKLDEAFAQTLINDANITVDGARAAIINKLGETPAPVSAPAAQPATDTAAATRAANTRASEILTAVRAAGFDVAYAETLINDSTLSADGARAAILNKLAESQSSAQTRSANEGVITPGADEVDKKRTGISNAILQRVNPGIAKSADAAEYRGMSLIDLGKECLTTAGINFRGMTPREVAQHSLNIGERQHSTSDFPNILASTVNRALRQAYDLQGRTFTPFCRATTAKDFRTMSRNQLSDFVSLDTVKEGGEYKLGTMSEAVESYGVVKYGKKIAITWEALINDDLNAFGRIPQAMAASCAQKQSDIVYAILTDNAALSDTVALFHASHGNLTSSGTALSVTSLGVARALFRKQTAPKGGKLNLTPKYLVVGPDLETLALQYTSQQYVSAKSSDINVWAGMLTPIVDARLTGNAWYLAADPSMIDTIEYAFLDGEEIFTEQRNGFDVDGLELKVRMVFGAKAIDYRGLYKNVGA